MSEKKQTPGQTPPLNGETAVQKPLVRTVDVSTSVEQALEWDRAGERIAFNTDRGSFKEFSDKELAEFSAWFKTTYRIMREVAKNQNPEADEFAKHFKVTNAATALGSPLDRLRNVRVKDGLTPMFVRPDLIGEFYEKGYRPPRAGEVLGGVHAREGHFELPDAVTGNTEQVLLVKDSDQEKADMKTFTERRLALGDEQSEAAKEAIKRTGYGVRDAPSEAEDRD